MKKAMILAAALVAVQMAFSGTFHKGTQLKEWAEASERATQGRPRDSDFIDATYLRGYIAGIVDGEADLFICVPPGVSIHQLEAMVIKHLNDNPSSWDLRANLLIEFALIPHYPCKKKE
jgi:hypothetical protein